MKKAILAFLFMSAITTQLVYAQTSSTKVPFFDLDISGSSGNYNGRTYSEVHLGVNMNFTEWLTWRNAAFKRFGSGGTEDDITGLDSSLRLVLSKPFSGGAFRFFLGPGYRWADPSEKNAGFAEGGLGLSFGRFSVSAGAKYLKYDKIQYNSAGAETKRDDLSYFLTLSGGAGLSF
ncbi:hypothetical protein [Pseudobdellovibrio exovorus]|uniref:Outer membrane protein beta-barrel domain-containing protein n=1 Tax=Pseudobdellovibrio exovorus JSS TaxID=1184267 RepID=M4VSG9_9BACT|nr:hypothetical protein [Pseudobdellovibrio exovorus]AGH96149.1 hypothetical protein A11Q_1933 [Pseudobdellovibrio exovorus JSS]